jgi:hypothetical protein
VERGKADPTLATLPTQPAVSCVDAGLSDSCYRLNQATCSPADGIAGVACYSNAERAGDPRGVVYGHVDRTAHKMVVQYLYFYYDDLYSNDYPPDDLFWQAHEGDWEVASVVLDRRSQQPLYAAYSQHCTGERRDWATSAGSVRTRSITSRIGSHANLFDAGSHPVATQCIPPAAADPGGDGLPARLTWPERGSPTAPVRRRCQAHGHPPG